MSSKIISKYFLVQFCAIILSGILSALTKFLFADLGTGLTKPTHSALKIYSVWLLAPSWYDRERVMRDCRASILQP